MKRDARSGLYQPMPMLSEIQKTADSAFDHADRAGVGGSIPMLPPFDPGVGGSIPMLPPFLSDVPGRLPGGIDSGMDPGPEVAFDPFAAMAAFGHLAD